MLLEFGFTEARVTKALKVTNNAGLQPALDWLEANPDDDGSLVEPEPENGGEIEAETAQSLKCDDCGKILKDASAAEWHAAKTQHVNFSESTQAIKPLTAEEKAKKVEELQARLAARREQKRLEAIEESKRKETVRRTTGAEMQLIREKLEREQMAKEVEERRRQKEEDRMAKEAVKRQLEADKLERQRQAEERKRIAAGQAAAPPPKPAALPVASSSGYNESRIQIRVPSGPPLTKVFQATDALSVVYDFVKQHHQGDFKLVQTFPRKVLDGPSLGQSLKDLGLCPSAALIVQ
ncbi:hypothetical protein HDV03_001501 [Kappamyces sp. JEL0829]|nr:hypothetical protein HDV03_001501 [Kappamyces sp. JEL0829]KAJ3371798.1 hypothetical protein HDU91_004873 [Kappamyces sp. JEL0680]